MPEMPEEATETKNAEEAVKPAAWAEQPWENVVRLALKAGVTAEDTGLRFELSESLREAALAVRATKKAHHEACEAVSNALVAMERAVAASARERSRFWLRVYEATGIAEDTELTIVSKSADGSSADLVTTVAMGRFLQAYNKLVEEFGPDAVDAMLLTAEKDLDSN